MADSKRYIEAEMKPVLVRTTTLDLSKDMKDQREAFLNVFRNSNLYGTTGRGADVMKTVGANFTREYAAWRCDHSCLAGLAQTDREYVAQPWWWAYGPTMQGAGLEFACLGSAKLVLEGERRCTIVELSSLNAWVNSRSAAGSSVSMKDLRDAICKGDEKIVESMIDGKVELYKVTQTVGQTLRAPWGYLVVEETLNAAECSGVRWLDVFAANTPAFKTMCRFMLPSARMTVKPGSTTALLAKIESALNPGTASAKPAVRLSAKRSLPAGSSDAAPSGKEVKVEGFWS